MERDYALVNDTLVHIRDYHKSNGKFNGKSNGECCCVEYGHKLIPIQGKNKWYYRHLVSKDILQHKKDICKKEWTQYGLPSFVFQFDYISRENVNFLLENNPSFIWMIYIENDVRVKKNNKHTYLEFINNHWKYESFINCPFIYLQIKNKIYCICPALVKSHMIDVVEPISKYYFVRLLKKGIQLDYEPIPQSTLYIKQQGAGNGKTFGIIQMLQHPAFLHYKRFVFVSKQHSARAIIHAEFLGQFNAGLLRITNVVDKEMNKKYIIHYRNHLGEDCSLIIATIDSFMYSIGNKDNKNTVDYFESIVKSIIDDSFINCDASGVIQFTDVKPKLNRETMLFIDETQDLSPFYADAILKLMDEKYVDAYIVGDKLQSLVNERNAFTRFIECDFPNKLMDIPANICRRFSHPKLIEFVNYMVPFEKHGLIPITPFSEKNDREIALGFICDTSVSKESNENNDLIELIMKEYNREVSTYHYVPENFLIVTPFVSVNPLVSELDMAINEYWKHKMEDSEYILQLNKNKNEYKNEYWISKLKERNKERNNKKEEKEIENEKETEEKEETDEEYIRYSIFHKSEEGTTISLDESNHATRIVSIHSSKGDGREVVFVVGLKESSLKIYAGHVDSLIYDSLLHVAITRMKKSMYVVYNPKDEIGRRIQTYRQLNDDFFDCEGIYDFKIKPELSLNSLLQFDKKVFVNLYDHIPCDMVGEFGCEKDNSFFNIRYYAMLMKSCLSFLKYGSDIVKQQLYVRIMKSCKSSLVICDNWRKYNLLLNQVTPRFIDGKYEKEMDCIPLVKLKGILDLQYFSVLYDTIQHIQQKLLEHRFDLCPFELVVLYYMEQVYNQGENTEITMNELYNIVDIFSKSFSGFSKGHGRCLCRKCFGECSSSKKNILTFFHNDLMLIDNWCKDIQEEYKGIQWNINHTVMMKVGSDIKLSTKCSLIGYTENSVVICYVKPWMNELDMKIRSLLDSFIVFNVSDENEKNKIKYSGKSIVCKFISLSGVVTIVWNNLAEVMSEIVGRILRESLVSYYLFQSKPIYPFYKYCVENEKDIMNEYRKFGDKNAEYISKFIEKECIECIELIEEMNEDIKEKDFMEKLEKCLMKEIMP